MSLHKDYDESPYVNFEEGAEDLQHKKQVRRLLEDRLEKKRLKDELEDEWSDEFDWDEPNP